MVKKLITAEKWIYGEMACLARTWQSFAGYPPNIGVAL